MRVLLLMCMPVQTVLLLAQAQFSDRMRINYRGSDLEAEPTGPALSVRSLRRVYVINKEVCVRTVCAHEELLRADLCRDQFSRCGVAALSGQCASLGGSCGKSCGGC
ncbi:microfibrillar-associated protein 2 [Lates japonicus]|uniref:Microfibrillar-associated protein 2 n=1 Tax=Lates japonicus TaxID=270547 RepID=A0AAD3RDI8_LATJO|nr:microfibrillar-associated protein 2 [Lates japonicus]